MKGENMMAKKYKVTAVICALAILVSSSGIYINKVNAAFKMMTPDDGTLIQTSKKINSAKYIETKMDKQQLLSGKKIQGKLVSGDDEQQYQISLISSGQLDIHLEDDSRKLNCAFSN